MSNKTDRELILELEEKLREQDKTLSMLLSMPASVGTIVAGPWKGGDVLKWTVASGDKQVVMETAQRKTKGLPFDPAKLNPGDLVMITETAAGAGLTGVLPEELHSLYGAIETVAEAPDAKAVVVERNGTRVRLQSVVLEPKAGDEVLVSNNVATKIVRRKPDLYASTFRPVAWDEIGGLVDAKRTVRQAIDAATSKSALGQRYGIKPPKGILLDGPPGNGKTLLARAAVTHLAKQFGGASMGSAYVFVSGPELLHWYVGATEHAVRSLFDKARKHHNEHGYPALVVIDEADALLPARGSRRSSDVDTTIVPTFLSEMDGAKQGSPIVMLLTNRPESIDSAILREGRVDVQITIPRPDRDAARRIAKVHLEPLPLKSEASEVVNALVDAIFANGLTERVSGAMLATAVGFMARVACDRDEALGCKKPSGIGVEDVSAAVAQLHRNKKEAAHAY